MHQNNVVCSIEMDSSVRWPLTTYSSQFWISLVCMHTNGKQWGCVRNEVKRFRSRKNSNAFCKRYTEMATERHAQGRGKNLCKKHSLSHNIGAIEATLQRRYDKHIVNGKTEAKSTHTERESACTYNEEKQTLNLWENSYASLSL